MYLTQDSMGFSALNFTFVEAPGDGVCDPTVTTACQSNICYMLISNDDDCKKIHDDANADCESRVSALGSYTKPAYFLLFLF